MGTLNTFEIFVLNKYSEVPYGLTLHGQIVLDCSEDMDVTEIGVQCFGKCRVELTDFRLSAVSLVDVHGAAITPVVINDTLMRENVVCFPTEPSANSSPDTFTNSRLSKGMNVFDFQFLIPANLPASFEGDYGYIRYFLRASVKLPDRVVYNMRNFEVISVLDLNCLPDVESAIEEDTETDIVSFFKSIGYYKAKVSLYKRGYVPGEPLHVQLNIENNTIKNMTKAVLRLKMVTTYRAKHQSRQCEKVLCISKLSPINAGYTFHGCDRNLRIPKDAVVSNIYSHRYIHVDYIVELTMQPSFLSLDGLKMCVKIEVGTIPLCNERLRASLVLREPPPRYEDLPPSYNDAIYQHLCSSEHQEHSDCHPDLRGHSDHCDCRSDNDTHLKQYDCEIDGETHHEQFDCDLNNTPQHEQSVCEIDGETHHEQFVCEIDGETHHEHFDCDLDNETQSDFELEDDTAHEQFNCDLDGETHLEYSGNGLCSALDDSLKEISQLNSREVAI